MGHVLRAPVPFLEDWGKPETQPQIPDGFFLQVKGTPYLSLLRILRNFSRCIVRDLVGFTFFLLDPFFPFVWTLRNPSSRVSIF